MTSLIFVGKIAFFLEIRITEAIISYIFIQAVITTAKKCANLAVKSNYSRNTTHKTTNYNEMQIITCLR